MIKFYKRSSKSKDKYQILHFYKITKIDRTFDNIEGIKITIQINPKDVIYKVLIENITTLLTNDLRRLTKASEGEFYKAYQDCLEYLKNL
jgi:hypothetical protein